MTFLRKFFSYHRNNRDAIIVLVAVIVTSVVLFPLLADDTAEEDAMVSNGQRIDRQNTYSQRDIGYGDGSHAVRPESAASLTPFPFDPNTADSTTLLRLGLKPWQVRNIYRYRAHGGYYRSPADFARLYGLTIEQYRLLEPYIRIAKTPAPRYSRDVIPQQHNRSDHRSKGSVISSSSSGLQAEEVPVQHSYKIRPGQKVDINKADTTELKTIPGIGSYFAKRIVERRKNRGAFLSTSELLEIRNFPESALEYVVASQNFPKIRLNSMSLQELHAHPLLSYTQAKDIVRLRTSQGRITSARSLSILSSFTDNDLRRLTPYIEF